MEIRLATLADSDAVRACVDMAFSHWIDIIGRKPTAMLTDFKPMIEAGQVHVALMDEAIVGVLIMWIAYESLYIDVLAVNPNIQKQGLGKQLLQFAEAEARRQNQSKLSLATNVKMQSNRDYYARYGYNETRFGTLEDGREIVWMEKPLTS